MSTISSITVATATAHTLAATKSSGPTNAQQQQTQFLQLLVAQLKGQNPLDPLDGTQFDSQLAQFSSLQELTGMHTDLDSIQKSLLPAAAASSAFPSQNQ